MDYNNHMSKSPSQYLQDAQRQVHQRLMTPEKKRQIADTLERSLPSSEQTAMTEEHFTALLLIAQLREESK